MDNTINGDKSFTYPKLDWRKWQGSFNGRESSLHQLSPYIGKLKTGMADALITSFSKPGNVVLDPYCGSGVIPLQASLKKRIAWANDLNPYGYVLTYGKLQAPSSIDEAQGRAQKVIDYVAKHKDEVDLKRIPLWVRQFFHPETLKETYLAFIKARQESDYFILSCLLGILHHQRPGFLSYPASHLVPYLRDKKFPRTRFSELYEYRDLATRLQAKVSRAYRNPLIPVDWNNEESIVLYGNTQHMPLPSQSVDVVISSPPYFGALSYARDNRLRLWFLGYEDWQRVDDKLTSKAGTYLTEMQHALAEIYRVLKSKSFCILVLGDVYQNGTTRNTAGLISTLASKKNAFFHTIKIYGNKIPNNRRSRRGTTTTKIERILIMKKM